MSISIEKTRVGISIPASVISVRVPDQKMPDCSGILSFFHTGIMPGLPKGRIFRHENKIIYCHVHALVHVHVLAPVCVRLHTINMNMNMSLRMCRCVDMVVMDINMDISVDMDMKGK